MSSPSRSRMRRNFRRWKALLRSTPQFLPGQRVCLRAAETSIARRARRSHGLCVQSSTQLLIGSGNDELRSKRSCLNPPHTFSISAGFILERIQGCFSRANAPSRPCRDHRWSRVLFSPRYSWWRRCRTIGNVLLHRAHAKAHPEFSAKTPPEASLSYFAIYLRIFDRHALRSRNRSSTW